MTSDGPMTAPLQVFKFGGASLRNPDSIRQVASIIRSVNTGPLVIVVSAMGKTTNALEAIWKARLNQLPVQQLVADLIAFHAQIVREIFPHPEALMSEIEKIVDRHAAPLPDGMDANSFYDQVVVAGELVSSLIVSEFLRLEGIEVLLHDAREFVVTDNA
ncbi:MAG: aspartate kinase, partial [Bacteroidota bacterium]